VGEHLSKKGGINEPYYYEETHGRRRSLVISLGRFFIMYPTGENSGIFSKGGGSPSSYILGGVLKIWRRSNE